jgi:hypothetical protein
MAIAWNVIVLGDGKYVLKYSRDKHLLEVWRNNILWNTHHYDEVWWLILDELEHKQALEVGRLLYG